MVVKRTNAYIQIDKKQNHELGIVQPDSYFKARNSEQNFIKTVLTLRAHTHWRFGTPINDISVVVLVVVYFIFLHVIF